MVWCGGVGGGSGGGGGGGSGMQEVCCQLVPVHRLALEWWSTRTYHVFLLSFNCKLCAGVCHQVEVGLLSYLLAASCYLGVSTRDELNQYTECN